MVTVPHIMVGLERMFDYRGVGLARFHCITLMCAFTFILQCWSFSYLYFSITIVPSKVPYTNVMATTSNGTAALYIEWEHPVTDLPIIRYKLSVATSDTYNGYTPQSIAKTVYTNNTNITIGELVLDTTYAVVITAESAIGQGQNNTLKVTTLAG